MLQAFLSLGVPRVRFFKHNLKLEKEFLEVDVSDSTRFGEG